ncbi:MAG TPA: hypothetical protein ENK91_05470 [Bacteroidetes bacterium]|nr:hypothetical protein [Bacteroidota bacterium]
MNLKKLINKIDSFYRENYPGYSEKELLELESLFNSIAFGFLLGHPVVPMHISLELLKDIDMESIERSINKAPLSTHPLSYLFSTFDIG